MTMAHTCGLSGSSSRVVGAADGIVACSCLRSRSALMITLQLCSTSILSELGLGIRTFLRLQLLVGRSEFVQHTQRRHLLVVCTVLWRPLVKFSPPSPPVAVLAFWNARCNGNLSQERHVYRTYGSNTHALVKHGMIEVKHGMID